MNANTERPIAPSGFQPNIAPGDGPGWDKAEYATPDRSQLDSGVYVIDRGLPWHVALSRRMDVPELMEGVDRKLTIGEALVLSGTDFDVDTTPAGYKVGRSWRRLPGRVVTYRTDTGTVLSNNTVSEGFTVVQNRDAFAFGDNILDEGGANVETAGSLFEGRLVFVSFELPDSIHVEGDESEYRLFLLISNGHDGKNALRASVTVERVVCRNTLRIAHKRAISSWTMKHTSGLEGRLAQAKQALGITHRYAETFAESASDLVSKTLAERQVDAILQDIYPLTEKQAERVDEKGEEAFAKVTAGKVRAVYHESPTVAPVKGTAYGILQAVTEYEDHIKVYRDSKSGSAADVRAMRLAFDDATSPDPKQRAWNILQSI